MSQLERKVEVESECERTDDVNVDLFLSHFILKKSEKERVRSMKAGVGDGHRG